MTTIHTNPTFGIVHTDDTNPLGALKQAAIEARAKAGLVAVCWTQQAGTMKEDRDPSGFFAFEVDRVGFAMKGAPDVADLVFVSWEPEDRDAALITAWATPAFAEWLDDEGIGHAFDPSDV